MLWWSLRSQQLTPAASRPKLPLVNLTIMRSINEKAELLVLLNYLSSTTGNRRWRNSVGHRLGAESVPSLKIATLIWSRSYKTDNHWEKPCQFFGFWVFVFFFFFAFSQTAPLVILNRSLWVGFAQQVTCWVLQQEKGGGVARKNRVGSRR